MHACVHACVRVCLCACIGTGKYTISNRECAPFSPEDLQARAVMGLINTETLDDSLVPVNVLSLALGQMAVSVVCSLCALQYSVLVS